MRKFGKGTYVVVPIETMRGQKPEKQVLYVWLCKYADELGKCWPSISTLMEVTGLGKTTVHKYLDELVSDGFLLKKNRIADDGKSYTSNEYHILYNPTPRDEPVVRETNEGGSLDELGVVRHTDEGSSGGEQKLLPSNSTNLTLPKKKKPFLFKKSSNEFALAEYFKNKREQRFGTIPDTPNLQIWAGDMNKLVRKNIPNRIIMDVIDFAFQDPWYSQRVVSPDGLIKEWSAIIAKGKVEMENKRHYVA